MWQTVSRTCSGSGDKAIANHWLPHAIVGSLRAANLRWQTRGGFTIGDTPEFAPEAVEWFSKRIATASHYIEYGSGASTLLAARAGAKTISIEGDDRYARSVRNALPENHDVRLLHADIGLTAGWSFPVFTRPTKARFAQWKAYAQRPLQIANEEGWTPQLVLVDGRFRRSCALHAAKAVVAAKGRATLFFDDYAPRPHFHMVEQFLGKPEIIGLSALFEIGEDTPSAKAEINDAVLAEAVQDMY